MNKHEYAIFIGRFNPFHLGHLFILRKGLEIAERLIVVLGSHNRALDIKNPWTSFERKNIILSSLSDEEKERVDFVFLKDYLYNDVMWTIDLQNKIAEATHDSDDIALIGYESDSSSYYLSLFPKWKYYSCPTPYEFHSTQIRNLIFKKDLAFTKMLSPEISNYIKSWMQDSEFSRLKSEFDFLSEYKEKWRGAPFPPTFVTVDAVVIKSGHILLVRRGKSHGKGLLALPGGFLNQEERILTACIRELKEETAIKISKEDLQSSVVDSKIFDHPNRSLRGRTISHAYLINLGAGDLPKVKGSDDADKAFWVPLNEVMQRESEFFEDHYYIIQFFVNKL
jgi:bifunctional NMN adenylyltransferase/nudix hydrolase